MSDGSTENYFSDELSGIVNSRFAVSSDQCNSGLASSQPISLIESNDNGFLGVYEPDPVYVMTQLELNSEVSISFEPCFLSSDMSAA